MKVLKDLGLIFGWNFFPLAYMLEVARLFWFGTFLAVEAKEGTKSALRHAKLFFEMVAA